MSDFFKNPYTAFVAAIIFMCKLGVVFLVKRWMETFSDTVFAALKKRKGSMLVPALILVVWFPIGSVIEAHFIEVRGIFGVWSIIVDLYMTYFLWVLLRVFFKRVKAEQEKLV